MTMPSCRKVARKSVSLLMELGLSKTDAARVVQLVCDEAVKVIWGRDPGMDTAWLASISAEAREMMPRQDTLGGPVATYSERVARWARDFDRGHSAQRLVREDAQLGRRVSTEFWPDSWPSAGAVHRDDMPAHFDVPGHERPGQTGRETGA